MLVEAFLCLFMTVKWILLDVGLLTVFTFDLRTFFTFQETMNLENNRWMNQYMICNIKLSASLPPHYRSVTSNVSKYLTRNLPDRSDELHSENVSEVKGGVQFEVWICRRTVVFGAFFLLICTEAIRFCGCTVSDVQ